VKWRAKHRNGTGWEGEEKPKYRKENVNIIYSNFTSCS